MSVLEENNLVISVYCKAFCVSSPAMIRGRVHSNWWCDQSVDCYNIARRMLSMGNRGEQWIKVVDDEQLLAGPPFSNKKEYRLRLWHMIVQSIHQFRGKIIARPKGVPPKAARPKDGLFRLHASWISPMQDLTVWPPSCVISENSRSLAAIFFSDGNSRHCSRVHLARFDLNINKKNYLQQIVIILAIRFAVLSTVFQWK